ncbi:YopX family protein [Leuconostoc lactis]|uniref:YopX family protein n=1 Tax=Leuconostoc lactis TaxID=1246 RepID=UPI003D6C4A36
MREIKFRAWFSRDNSYVEPHTIQEMIFQKVSDIPLDVLYNEFEFEQYTGLKDKNRVEIYEGDIIVNHWDDEERGVVEYDSYDGFNITPNLSNQAYWSRMLVELEVIGNIHENPELLEEL